MQRESTSKQTNKKQPGRQASKQAWRRREERSITRRPWRIRLISPSPPPAPGSGATPGPSHWQLHRKPWLHLFTAQSESKTLIFMVDVQTVCSCVGFNSHLLKFKMCIFKQTDLYHHQYHKFINILKSKSCNYIQLHFSEVLCDVNQNGCLQFKNDP